MSDQPNVTGGQLAQAAGCDPANPCYFECARAWKEKLANWDRLQPWEQENILGYAAWIAEQRWV